MRGDHTGSSQFRQRLIEFAAEPQVRTTLAQLAPTVSAAALDDIFAGMSGAKVRVFPAEWAPVLQHALESTDDQRVQAGVRVAHAQAKTGLSQKLISTLQQIGQNKQLEQRIRLQAFSASSVARANRKLNAPELSADVAAFVTGSLSVDTPGELRGFAVEILSSAAANQTLMKAMIAALPQTGPAELQQLLPVVCRSASESFVDDLLTSLEKSPFAVTLSEKFLRTELAGISPAAPDRAAELFRRIHQDRDIRRARMERVLTKMETADERRGQSIFHSSKTSCIVCHQMGYLGGNIGPGLRNIGSIRSDRDLLESILFPSASFVRSYEPVTILMTSGKSFSGLIREENSSVLSLALNAQKTVTLERKRIDRVIPSRVSIMPAGLGKLLSDQDLADLVKFLKESR